MTTTTAPHLPSAIEHLATDALVPYARNSRTHSPEQVAQIAASIREFGFTNPVLIDANNTLIAGHGRVMAAQHLGLSTVPAIRLAHLTDAQRRAYVIADNKLAENAGWDMATLAREVEDLTSDGYDIDLLGFGADELTALLGEYGQDAAKPGDGLTDPDEAPAVQATPVTKLGDVWVMGKHRLMCGDSTSEECISTLMAGKRADLCFTSPPYGQQRDYKSGGISDWDALMNGVFTAMPVKPTAQVLVNLGLIHKDCEWVPYWEKWIGFMRSKGWRSFGWYVWDQGPGLPGDWNGRLAPSHEFIFHFNRVAERARKTKEKLPASIQYNDHGNGMRKKDGTMSGISSPELSLQTHKVPDSVIRVMRHKARGIEVEHPAVFPINLVTEIITAFSDAGDIVFEPFIGSGTQIIAAEQNARKCYGMELAPVYTDLAIRRWQAFTGKSATLESTGHTFDQVKQQRLQIA
jgi:DNA modification methylase